MAPGDAAESRGLVPVDAVGDGGLGHPAILFSIGQRATKRGLNKGEGFINYVHDTGLVNPTTSIIAGVRGTDADLDVTLDLLERDDKAEIISNPRITTADNKEAKILVGKKIPLVISDEAGNAVTELTTIGVKLTVVPHINQDDRITLDLAPEVSDLSSQATVQGGIVIVTSA